MAPEIIKRGPLTLYLTAQRSLFNETDMKLTPKEFAILLLFIRKPDKPLSKEYIYNKVWGQLTVGDYNAFYAQIKLLKKKLEQYDGFELCVSRNEGYYLNILP